MVRAFGAQAVARREKLIEFPQIGSAFEVGQFMNNDIGPRFRDGGANGISLKRIGDDRVCAHLANDGCIFGSVGQAGDGVARRDKARNQPHADRAGRARYKDSHSPPPFEGNDQVSQLFRPVALARQSAEYRQNT
jgi:hypothetical protein